MSELRVHLLDYSDSGASVALFFKGGDFLMPRPKKHARRDNPPSKKTPNRTIAKGSQRYRENPPQHHPRARGPDALNLCQRVATMRDIAGTL